MYILTEDDDGDLVADGYPTAVGAGESAEIVVGVDNNEHRTVEYTLVVVEQDVEIVPNETATDSSDPPVNETVVTEQNELDRFETRLEHNESWHHSHEFEPTITGDDTRIVWLLFPRTFPRSRRWTTPSTPFTSGSTSKKRSPSTLTNRDSYLSRESLSPTWRSPRPTTARRILQSSPPPTLRRSTHGDPDRVDSVDYSDGRSRRRSRRCPTSHLRFNPARSLASPGQAAAENRRSCTCSPDSRYRRRDQYSSSRRISRRTRREGEPDSASRRSGSCSSGFTS